MKRKQTVLIFALVFVSVTCIVIYVISNSFNEQGHRFPKNGLSDFYPDNISYFKYDPATVLANLDRGKTDLFVVESVTPTAPLFDTTFSWLQSDYLKVANAASQFVWKESIDGWNLLSMIFETTCRDNPNGFEESDIHFFKVVEIDGESIYITREVIITPRYGNLAWGGGGDGANFSNTSSEWKSIDSNRLTINAEDAMRMAEAKGGKSFRLSRNNECTIGLILNIDAYGGWHVEYYGDAALPNFKIEINPYTGKVIK